MFTVASKNILHLLPSSFYIKFSAFSFLALYMSYFFVLLRFVLPVSVLICFSVVMVIIILSTTIPLCKYVNRLIIQHLGHALNLSRKIISDLDLALCTDWNYFNKNGKHWLYIYTNVHYYTEGENVGLSFGYSCYTLDTTVVCHKCKH